VNKGVLTLMQMIDKLSTRPRAILSLPVIQFNEGAPANMTIIDPGLEWVVDKEALKSKSKNTPFHGVRLKGKAIGIINNGKATIG
jgi:dihydroorotase